MNLQQMAMNIISQNPRIANNPNARAMVDAIRNNDAQAGTEIANNLLQTYGLSKEDGIAQAKAGLQQMTGMRFQEESKWL